MPYEIKQFDSLQKIYGNDFPEKEARSKAVLLSGERYNRQIAIKTDERFWFTVKVNSELKDFITVYRVENAVMDMAAVPTATSKNYITLENGIMPDILIPIDESTAITAPYGTSAIWIELNFPENFAPGTYSVEVELNTCDAFSIAMENKNFTSKKHTCNFEVEVLNKKLSDRKIIYTQWIHLDCIASAHNVGIFSEQHWNLIEKYIKTAAKLGINMILTPVHTPPLDTSKGIYRENVSLIEVLYDEKSKRYSFNPDKLERYIDICLKCGIEYFEIAHLFSQWGSEFAAPITVNGEHKFGWNTRANSEEYREFLKQYVPTIIRVFEKRGLCDRLYFHISDEPSVEKIDKYRAAYDLLKPMLGNIKTIDAVSEYDFYEQGLIKCPITITGCIDEFLKHNIKEQWAYYCWCVYGEESNRLMSMPSHRNRIIGMQMFKYNIKGFLHWGYNFYNSCCSTETINPYITSSANKVFPSGDSFSVYPGKDGAYISLRAMVFFEALQDIRILNTLSEYIGHDKTVKMIEDIAGSKIEFNDYPHDSEFIISVIEKAKEKIFEHI